MGSERNEALFSFDRSLRIMVIESLDLHPFALLLPIHWDPQEMPEELRDT